MDKDKELIVGLQTDEPMKRIMNPYGGFRMVKSALEAYDLETQKDRRISSMNIENMVQLVCVLMQYKRYMVNQSSVLLGKLTDASEEDVLLVITSCRVK